MYLRAVVRSARKYPENVSYNDRIIFRTCEASVVDIVIQFLIVLVEDELHFFMGVVGLGIVEIGHSEIVFLILQ